MPTATYTPLATITLGSSASSVTFSNIPNTYRDLIVVVNGSASAYTGLTIEFNGSTANFSWVQMLGNGSTTDSGSGSNNEWGAAYNQQSVIIGQLMDYSATDKHKTFLGRQGAAGLESRAVVTRWASTAAVTSFKLGTGGFNWSSGTTFSLFGIVA